MPKVTEFLKKKKDPETPLEKAVTIKPAVATPLSEASFGEKGDGSTPPPQIIPSTPAPGAKAAGKENADGPVSKLQAFVMSFGVKTEPDATA